MLFQIEIETDNSAFEDSGELGRLLRKMADQVDEGRTTGPVIDINGNQVGSYRFGTAR